MYDELRTGWLLDSDDLRWHSHPAVPEIGIAFVGGLFLPMYTNGKFIATRSHDQGFDEFEWAVDWLVRNVRLWEKRVKEGQRET